MKKMLVLISMCFALACLTACSGDNDTSYSVTVRNAAEHVVTLRDISVNGRTYIMQATPLATAGDKSVSNDYLMVFSGGRTVTVTVEIFDEITGREIKFAERFTDRSGDGYAILLEYKNGVIRAEVSRVGRLSDWGSK